MSLPLLLLFSAPSQLLPDWQSLVESINDDPESTWKAGMPDHRTVSRLPDLRGFIPYKGGFKAVSRHRHSPKAPDAYDARTAYPACPSIQRVRDQCGCGSCFAFGSVEAFEDRLCIHNHKNVTLSVQDIISCHIDENLSCDGGNPITVWQNVFAGRSEGDGAIEDSCYPYEIKPCPCNHHSPNSTLPKCKDMAAPTCDFSRKIECEAKALHRSQAPTLVLASEMEQEIVQNGPITVAYTVFSDFLTYRSGIYQKSAAAHPLGGHSVKIVGYGEEAGVKYWTVANSWNSEFGEKGFFRIVRGQDECGIESLAVVAGIPAKSS